MGKTLRTGTHNGVRSIVLTRAAEYNTITPEFRDELAAAIDEADSDRGGSRDSVAGRGRRVLRGLPAGHFHASADRGGIPRASMGLSRGLSHDFTLRKTPT
jgi:enoyl-CoA hydratase/carnithine racemase